MLHDYACSVVGRVSLPHSTVCRTLFPVKGQGTVARADAAERRSASVWLVTELAYCGDVTAPERDLTIELEPGPRGCWCLFHLSPLALLGEGVPRLAEVCRYRGLRRMGRRRASGISETGHGRDYHIRWF